MLYVSLWNSIWFTLEILWFDFDDFWGNYRFNQHYIDGYKEIRINANTSRYNLFEMGGQCSYTLTPDPYTSSRFPTKDQKTDCIYVTPKQNLNHWILIYNMRHNCNAKHNDSDYIWPWLLYCILNMNFTLEFNIFCFGNIISWIWWYLALLNGCIDI